MRLAWAGVVIAGVGLVLSALLWTFAVQTRELTGGQQPGLGDQQVVVGAEQGGAVDPPVTPGATVECIGRGGLDVPCEVLGFDMRWGSFTAFVVLALSVLLAYVAIRTGQGPRRGYRVDD